MKKVTRKDIAIEAGVSETVVSYVINNNRYVNADKKKRVLEAIKKLDYKPNPVARALRGKTNNHVLFIADDMMSEYFGIIIGEMDKRLSGKGYMISLAADKGDPTFIERVLDWNFDGVIVGSKTISNESIQALISSNIPTVLLAINKYPEFNGDYGIIYTGLMYGAEDAVNCMKMKGRKNIVYIDSLSKEGLNKLDFRYLGYINSVESPIIISGCDNQDMLEQQIKDTYLKYHFDGILARTDSVALIAMKEMEKMGIDVKNEISIVGFNNSKICEYTSPSLSSVRIRQDLIAESALALLIKLRENKSKGAQKIELNTELVKRESL